MVVAHHLLRCAGPTACGAVVRLAHRDGLKQPPAQDKDTGPWPAPHPAQLALRPGTRGPSAPAPTRALLRCAGPGAAVSGVKTPTVLWPGAGGLSLPRVHGVSARGTATLRSLMVRSCTYLRTPGRGLIGKNCYGATHFNSMITKC